MSYFHTAPLVIQLHRQNVSVTQRHTNIFQSELRVSEAVVDVLLSRIVHPEHYETLGDKIILHGLYFQNQRT
jgi:hypothetical protein